MDRQHNTDPVAVDTPTLPSSGNTAETHREGATQNVDAGTSQHSRPIRTRKQTVFFQAS